MNSETTASVSREQNLGPNGAQLPSWEFPVSRWTEKS